MSLSGRLALVIGGGSGIGEAVCRLLAEEDAAVIVADKHGRRCDECSRLFARGRKASVRGTFLVIREASRYILQSGQPMPEGGAAIVNVASIFGKSGQENAAAYCASKGGVVALTKSAAQELAPHGIRCNARMAQPLEVAEAIKFLCLPNASSFITGAALEVTGGWRM
ncbi:hypothetical protein MRX96_037756 [Rhipicephalus microplus]